MTGYVCRGLFRGIASPYCIVFKYNFLLIVLVFDSWLVRNKKMGSYDEIIEFNNTAQLGDEAKSSKENLEKGQK